MYRLLALLLVVLLVVLQMKLWNGGEGSWTAEQDLKVQVEQQRAENARLTERNAALEAEVEDLKTGEAAVEERARSEIGMVKPGETFYRVVEPQDPGASMRPEDVPEDATPATQASASQSVPASTQSSMPAKSVQASTPSSTPAQSIQASPAKPQTQIPAAQASQR